ncbi:hypothetical protein [Campylobacter sputorum]|uniref:hypothetical protein n=1 Tax=Campylobacter sputorum TaxID=206 RepID=UPI000B798275|nr:hypothetical protein [Campylobacter sputorum]ASM37483.1 hypothetical protein CSF_1647 [Campylobacter sputorum bv. faecalis CCUG 20703]
MKKFIYFLIPQFVVFLICAFLTLILWDIFQAKDVVSLGIKSLIWIGFSVFLLLIAFYHLKNITYVTNHSIIAMIFVSLICIFLVQKTVMIQKSSEFLSSDSKVFLNPFFDEYIKIAKHYNLNLNFTEKVWKERGPNDFMIHEIFKEKPKSIDILMFGDSSLAWGVIPQVIEQLTDKKVAIYAYESNLLNVKSSKLFNKLASYYLKDDGMIIYAFAAWTQNKTANDLLISKETCDKIANFSFDEFKEFTNKIIDENKISFFDKYLSLNSFKAKFDEISKYLGSNYDLKLISPNIYGNYLEPIINKEWHTIKNKNTNKDTIFLRWDKKSITQHSTKFNNGIFKDFNQSLINKNFSDGNISINSKEATKISGKDRIYMKPFYTENDQFWLNVYDKYYKDSGFIFANLTPYALSLEKELNIKIIMQGGTHTGNTGGLIESIAIAKWINDFYNK